MVRRIKSKKTLKKRYFGELLTEKEIKSHGLKSNFGTNSIEEIYQKELAGHIVNFFIKWGEKLDIPQEKIDNLKIVDSSSEKYLSRYNVLKGIWEFKDKMKYIPIDIIDYLTLYALAEFIAIRDGKDILEVVGTNMPDYKERVATLEEIENLGVNYLSQRV